MGGLRICHVEEAAGGGGAGWRGERVWRGEGLGAAWEVCVNLRFGSKDDDKEEGKKTNRRQGGHEGRVLR